MERAGEHNAASGRQNGSVDACVYLHVHVSPLKIVHMQSRNDGKWSSKNVPDLRVPTN